MPIQRRAIDGLGTLFSKRVSFTGNSTVVNVPTDGARFVAPFGIIKGPQPSFDSGDNPVSFKETLNANGLIEVGTDGTVTLERNTSGTANMDMVVSMISTQGGDRTWIDGYGRIIRRRAQFTGTGQTIQIDAGGMKRVRVLSAFSVTPAAFTNLNILFVDQTPDANGFIDVAADGTFAMRRAGAGTADLPIIVWITEGDSTNIPGLGTIFSERVIFNAAGGLFSDVTTRGYSNVLAFASVAYATPPGASNGQHANIYLDSNTGITVDANGVMDTRGETRFRVQMQTGGPDDANSLITCIGQ